MRCHHSTLLLLTTCTYDRRVFSTPHPSTRRNTRFRFNPTQPIRHAILSPFERSNKCVYMVKCAGYPCPWVYLTADNELHFGELFQYATARSICFYSGRVYVVCIFYPLIMFQLVGKSRLSFRWTHNKIFSAGRRQNPTPRLDYYNPVLLLSHMPRDTWWLKFSDNNSRRVWGFIPRPRRAINNHDINVDVARVPGRRVIGEVLIKVL